MDIRMLVDSGSSLAGALARKLRAKGCETRNIDKALRIKVANGKKSIVQEAMPLKLKFGDETAEQVDFLILEDLPFDFILGNETLMKWKGVIDWGENVVAITNKRRLTI